MYDGRPRDCTHLHMLDIEEYFEFLDMLQLHTISAHVISVARLP